MEFHEILKPTTARIMIIEHDDEIKNSIVEELSHLNRYSYCEIDHADSLEESREKIKNACRGYDLIIMNLDMMFSQEIQMLSTEFGFALLYQLEILHIDTPVYVYVKEDSGQRALSTMAATLSNIHPNITYVNIYKNNAASLLLKEAINKVTAKYYMRR